MTASLNATNHTKQPVQQDRSTTAASRGKMSRQPQQVTIDQSPIDLFKKMSENDKLQNKRLSGSNGAEANTIQADFGKGFQPERNTGDYQRVTRVRFLVCALGLFAICFSQGSRMIFNVSITQMVHPSMLTTKTGGDGPAKGAVGSCPAPEPVERQHDERIEIDSTTARLDAETTSTTAATTPTSLPTTTATAAPPPTSPPTTATGLIATTTKSSDYAYFATTGQPDSWSEVEPTSCPKLSDETGTAETTSTATAQSIGGPTSEADSTTTSEPSGVTTESAAPGGDEEEVVVVVEEEGEEEEAETFKWTVHQQHILLGGFFYSYSLFMIWGGRLAEIYGSKWIMVLNVGASGLINLLTPLMARTSFSLLLGSRVLLGVVQSGVVPSSYALFNRWLTMTEASIFTPLIKTSLRLGMLSGSLLPGLLSTWQAVFYTSGVVCLAWTGIWIVLSSSTPHENPFVSDAELSRIMRKKRRPRTNSIIAVEQNPQTKDIEMVSVELEKYAKTGADEQPEPKKRDTSTPWLKLFTAPSVIGLVVIKITFNMMIDFVTIELPSYLKNVHHATKEQISAITTPVFLIQVILIGFVGWLAKTCVQKRPFGVSKTVVRKVFQGLASYGSAVTLWLMTYHNCNLTYVIVMLQVLAFLSMFTAGGETVLPYDLSDEYPATIAAIANSAGNVTGIFITNLTSYVLGDQGCNSERWNIVIRIIAAGNAIGCTLFCFLVTAKPIDFSSKEGPARLGAQQGDLESGILPPVGHDGGGAAAAQAVEASAPAAAEAPSPRPACGGDSPRPAPVDVKGGQSRLKDPLAGGHIERIEEEPEELAAPPADAGPPAKGRATRA